MNLLKNASNAINISEDAAGGAVGAGSVSAIAMPLFTTLVNRANVSSPAVKTIKYSSSKKNTTTKKRNKSNLGIKEAFYTIYENDNPMAQPTTDDGTSNSSKSFDTTDVISKLKSLERKEKTDVRDTTTFGLEDDNGGLVRVTVKSENAVDFEKALQSIMSDVDDGEDLPEIAEVLFKLKDNFDIVDIEWPEIEEDEEIDQGAGDLPGLEGGASGELGGAGGDLGDGDLNLPDASTGEDTGQVKDLLTQVIDMMKADADARKAEAQAREAEAKGREAESATKQTYARVKQEEQMLDMDAYTKSKKEESKEAKRLAQLARWKHEMGDNEDDVDTSFDPTLGKGHEEEEIHQRPSAGQPQPANKGSTVRGKVHPRDIAQFILNRVK